MASCGCAAIKQVAGAVKDKRAPYLTILFVFTLVAGLLRYFGQPLRLDYIVSVEVCIDPSRCYGIGAVYRITLCMFLFFGAHYLALLAGPCAQRGIEKGYWAVKILILLGLLVLCFVLPPQVCELFRWVAMIGAVLFVVIQVIIYIDWAYAWNEEWVGKGYQKRVVGLAVFNYALCLVAMGLMIHYFANGPSCTLEQTFIGVTCVLTLLFSLFSITEYCEHGAILPSSVCTLYCYWLLYSALSSDPTTCNSFLVETGKKPVAQIVLGFLVAAVSVAYNSFYAHANSHALILEGGDEGLLDSPIKLVDDRTEEGNTEPREEPVLAALADRRSSRHFQLILASGACYACMLLSDWGEAKDSLQGPGFISVWVQMSSQWLTMVLYMWSLVAPYVLTCRQF